MGERGLHHDVPGLDAELEPIAVGRITSADLLSSQQIDDELAALVQVADGDEMNEFNTLLMNEDEAADRVVPHADLRIKVIKHTIHREDNPNTENSVFVVSKDRWFNLELRLEDSAGRLAVENNDLAVEAGVVFDNGGEVPIAGPHEQRLLGPQELSFINGKGLFKLKMGPSILSQRHGEQKFRVRVWPVDPALRAAHPSLTIHSAPMKSVTKLFRKKPGEVAAEKARLLLTDGGEGSAAGGALVVTTTALNAKLEDEVEQRQLLEYQVSLLTSQVADEAAKRIAVESELKRQGAMMEAMMAQMAVLGVVAPGATVTATAEPVPPAPPAEPAVRHSMPPPPTPAGGPRPAPLPPTAVRSRSPRRQPGADDPPLGRPARGADRS